ncbi:MAG TPA: SWIM zinc finger family protein [Pirellulales bacterium]|nr:SWIM zinc finger family protein [Pirellulales bacterium]
MGWYQQWKPYVSVAQRRAQAVKYAAGLAKREKRVLCPVTAGRKITETFWGRAWCDNLERYSDFANRLPRGRSYARNGSVIDLQIKRGSIQAIVSGSDIYRVSISIKTLGQSDWKRITQDCVQSINSLLDLMQGRFDQGVMERLTRRDGGLFPKPHEIQMQCSCPDWAGLCKHVAAVMYCVGVRLDSASELLFTLRAVDHRELISQVATTQNLDRMLAPTTESALGTSDLGELFGIELDSSAPAKPRRSKKTAQTTAAPAASKPAASKPAVSKRTGAKRTKTKPARSELKTETIALSRPKSRASATDGEPARKQRGKTAKSTPALATRQPPRHSTQKRATANAQENLSRGELLRRSAAIIAAQRAAAEELAAEKLAARKLRAKQLNTKPRAADKHVAKRRPGAKVAAGKLVAK